MYHKFLNNYEDDILLGKTMPKKTINKEELKRKFAEFKQNLRKTAEYFDSSIGTIINRLIEFDIPYKSNSPQTKTETIYKGILDYLDIHGCGLRSQIINSFNEENGWYHSNCLNHLVHRKQVIKQLYRTFDFYILPGNESEIKRKIRVLQRYILECVGRFGPIKGRPLVEKIKENYDVFVNSRLVFHFAKELIEDGKLGSKKDALSHIYFIKSNKNQELEAKQIANSRARNSKLESVKEIFYSELDREFALKEIEKAEWASISKKMAPFLKIECSGRSHLHLIRTIYFMLIKRELFLRVLKQTNIQELIPLLRLYDIIEKKNEEHFQGFAKKTYRYFKKEILNHQQFCEKNLRGQILNTPDIPLRIQYSSITFFGFDTNYSNKINILFKNAVENGYNISGKSARGILGGLLYYFSENLSLGLTQGYIANKLDVTEVTLRSRYKEIKKLSPNFNKLNIEKHEVKVTESDVKEIESHSKIKNQKELISKKSAENEDIVIYIEDDENIDKKASEVAYEIKIQLLFEQNVGGLYQSSCGRTYRYKSSLLNHFLNCPECSNRLLKKEENSFFRCNCYRTYRYAYQFANHIKKCHDFKNYLESLLHQDTLVKHRIRKRES